MRSMNRGLLCIVTVLAVLTLPKSSLAQAPVAANQPGANQTTVSAPSRDSSGITTASAELPDSPGAEWSKSQQSSQENQGNSSNAQSAQSSSAPEQKAQRPVGTAAAEAPKVTGITAAEPAGIAIAPGKQHRARALVIKVGAIVGACVAVGTVVALSEATYSKPPGAH